MHKTIFRTFDTLLDKTIVLNYTGLGYALRQAAWDDADLEALTCWPAPRVQLRTGNGCGTGVYASAAWPIRTVQRLSSEAPRPQAGASKKP